MPERSSIAISGNDGFRIPVPVSPVYTIFDDFEAIIPGVTHYQFIVPPDGMVYSLVQFDVLSDELIWFITSVYVNGVQIFGDISGYPPKYCPGLGKTVKLRHPDIIDIYIWHVYSYAHTYYWSMDFWREPGGSGAYEVSPLALFTVSGIKGRNPYTVNFTNGSYGTNLTYDWDFGDGSDHSTEKDPSHIYTAAGKYYPSLTISNSIGEVTYILPLAIEVFNYILLDDFTVYDPDDSITLSNEICSFSLLHTLAEAKVYKNYGANYWSDINISCKLFVSATYYQVKAIVMGLSTNDGIFFTDGGSKLRLQLESTGGDTFTLAIDGAYYGYHYTGSSITLDKGQVYKLVLTRTYGTYHAECNIYYGPDFDIYVGTIVLDHAFAAPKYAYLFPVASLWYSVGWQSGVCTGDCGYVSGYVSEFTW